MRFGLQTLLVLMTAAALFGLFIKSPTIAFFTMLLALPAMIVVAGITSPQKGTVLDVRARSTFTHLLRLWLFLWIGLLVLLVVTLAFPDLPTKFKRWQNGDFRSYRFILTTRSNLDELIETNSIGISVYDNRGFVGELRNVDSYPDDATHFLLISTDRSDYSESPRQRGVAEVRDDGTLYVEIQTQAVN